MRVSCAYLSCYLAIFRTSICHRYGGGAKGGREAERSAQQVSWARLDLSCLFITCSTFRSDSLLRHYIANAWLAKLDTVAEPGPIDNSSVICQHGGVRFNR